VGLTGEVDHRRGSSAAEERRYSNDSGSSRWSARAPTALGRKGEHEAHEIEGASWRELTKRGGRGVGGFDFGTIDGGDGGAQSFLKCHSGMEQWGSGTGGAGARRRSRERGPGGSQRPGAAEAGADRAAHDRGAGRRYGKEAVARGPQWL
jgi:hypothetical protein